MRFPATKHVVGLVTCGSRAEARKLAGAVLKKKLAACVNILEGVESHYWWRGKREQAKECLLLIKTSRDKASAVATTVKAHHSYDTPEIVFLPIQQGERSYLKWILDSTR